MIRVSILGATGYSGGELLKILLNRKDVQLIHLTSESSVGKPVWSSHAFLRGRLSHQFEAVNLKKMSSDTDVVFSCYPAAIGIKNNASLSRSGVKVIDLSGDFRLPTAVQYEQWYKEKHTAPLDLKRAVYGLPELFRSQIRQSTLIANPGCYATAAILAAYPLIAAKCVDSRSLIVDAKSGVSGAGKKVALQYLYCEVNEDITAYSVANHRHQPEIEHVLGRAAKTSVQVTFTPHLVPMNRGIFSVLYATLKKGISAQSIRSLYEERYRDEPFIRLLPEGETPHTKHVSHTNYCDIGITHDKRMNRVIVMSAIDNLVKGAAGQAVQNMNILFNRSESEGLL